MIAREDSCPPDASAASTPVPPAYNDTPPPSNRKRKHAAISGAIATPTSATSPAPSDPGLAGAQAAGASILPTTDENIVDDRPRLTVSRPPVFVPVSEGSIYHSTEQIAVNRLGFRYIPAGLSEHGSKIPFRTIESFPPGYVRASWEDRSPFLKVTTDGLGLCGEKGYRSARLNVPVREGKWYMEIKIESGGGDKLPENATKEGAHVRLGWGRREAGLNCPVGLDGYSYGYLDKDGHKVTLSRPRPYGEKFGTGDVIGMYISLPPKRLPNPNDPHDPAHLKHERIAIDFKGQAYFESVEYPQSKEMIALMDSSANKAKDTAPVPSSAKKSATVKNLPERGRGNKPLLKPAPFQPLPVLRGSHLAFFLNGKSQGIAFQDIYDYLQLRTVPSARNNRSRRRLREGYVEHTENPFDDGWLGYYPFISLFNGARVRINAGPNFDFPPPTDIEGALAGDPDSADTKTRTWRPLCERYTEFMEEQRELDARDEVEAQNMAQQPAIPPPKKERTASDHPKQSRHSSQHPKPPKAQLQPKAPPEAKASPKPPPSRAPSIAPSVTPAIPKDPPILQDKDIAQSEAQPEALPDEQPQEAVTAPPAEPTPEMTELEKKLEARRARKRELERARRAKKREEKLLLKKLEEEQKLSAVATGSASTADALAAHMETDPSPAGGEHVIPDSEQYTQPSLPPDYSATIDSMDHDMHDN